MNEIEQNYQDFISTVSHELRTPLTSIRGFSQTMLNSWDKLDDESKKKFIKIIEEQSNRLIHLVENMLNVTKLQGGRENLFYSETDVKTAVSQVIAIVKSKYPEHIFKTDINENIPVFVDKDKFEQILVNLFENSVKYSIDSNVTDITVKINDGKIVINISNLGIPIKQEDFEKIFTKFARIDNPLTRKVQGSGLGLYITKNLTEQMSGEISVNSEQTENSDKAKITFTLKFPILNIEQQARMKCNQ